VPSQHNDIRWPGSGTLTVRRASGARWELQGRQNFSRPLTLTPTSTPGPDSPGP